MFDSSLSKQHARQQVCVWVWQPCVYTSLDRCGVSDANSWQRRIQQVVERREGGAQCNLQGTGKSHAAVREKIAAWQDTHVQEKAEYQAEYHAKCGHKATHVDLKLTTQSRTSNSSLKSQLIRNVKTITKSTLVCLGPQDSPRSIKMNAD